MVSEVSHRCPERAGIICDSCKLSSSQIIQIEITHDLLPQQPHDNSGMHFEFGSFMLPFLHE